MAGKKHQAKKSGVSAEIYDAAKTIAELKGDDVEDLEAKFFIDYVHENLHVLTENAKGFIASKEGKTDNA